MGYNANGYVAITCTDATQLTAMALMFEELAETLTTKQYTDDILQEMRSEEGDVLLRALAACRFTDGAKEVRDGTTVYSAYYDDKWWEGAEFVHRLAAQSGMKVQGEFRGEDDAEWAWASADGKYVEEEIVHVLGSEHATLMQAKSDLAELNSLLCHSEAPSAEDITRAREVLATYSPKDNSDAAAAGNGSQENPS